MTQARGITAPMPFARLAPRRPLRVLPCPYHQCQTPQEEGHVPTPEAPPETILISPLLSFPLTPHLCSLGFQVCLFSIPLLPTPTPRCRSGPCV